MNRLKLDFTLNTTQERTHFLQDYLQSPQFQTSPLTPDEIETCSNYILWGKESDGKSAIQKKEIEIETRHKTWNSRKDEESLEALLETPTFNEQSILPPTEATPKFKKEVFNRTQALKKAPKELHSLLKNLFYEIDSLDLLLNFYDIRTGKRSNPPRKELLDRFTDEETQKIKAKSLKLNQFQYLKLRHHLVEKRKEQYTIKDTYSEPLQQILPQPFIPSEQNIIGEDIPVFPLGIKEAKNSKIFPNLRDISIEEYTEEDLKEVSKRIWDLETQKQQLKNRLYFSFLEEEHLYKLLLLLNDIEEEEHALESLSQELLDTLRYYIDMADLSDIQKEILELKIKGETNLKIVEYINQKYQRSYTVNYISTIFTQQIIKKISMAAALHQKVMENIFYPENFKKCNHCGATLLRDADFFMRRSRSNDGFTSRCKKCDKIIRGGYK